MTEYLAYREQFQIEGELKPTTYLFICPFATPNLYQTTCKWLVKYIHDNMPKFDQIAPNIWAMSDLDQWPKMEIVIFNYYENTGGFCNEV
jgi:hypothetical protein